MSEIPDSPITEIDSVEGTKGGKVLLTIHFVKAELMLAFIRGANTSQSVIDIFDRLYIELRPDIFMNCLFLPRERSTGPFLGTLWRRRRVTEATRLLFLLFAIPFPPQEII